LKQGKEERLLALTCALLAAPSFGLTKQQLFESVKGYREGGAQASLDKMFERDKAELRASGVAIETIGSPDNPTDPTESRYRISRASFEWPEEFLLTPGQLRLLDIAARAWSARSMSAPATQALFRLRSLGLIDTEADSGVFSPHVIATDPSFEPLAEAIAELTSVFFSYQKPGAEPSLRTVQPWRLRQLQGQWVLLGLDTDVGEPRNYLLRRITSPIAVAGQTFDAPTASELSAAERALEHYAAENRARLLLAPDSEAAWHFGAGAGGEVTISYMDAELLAERLREFGRAVKVLEPTALAELVVGGLERVLEQHAQS
jgi:proteasome accessory factor B